jgi:hypothetical protein
MLGRMSVLGMACFIFRTTCATGHYSTTTDRVAMMISFLEKQQRKHCNATKCTVITRIITEKLRSSIKAA